MALLVRLFTAVSVLYSTSNFNQVLALCDSPSAVQNGKLLTKSVFRYAPNSDMFSCAAMCLSHALCKSFNLNLLDQSCYLNYNSSIDEGNLQPDDAYLHSDIEDWPRAVAGRCKDTICNLQKLCTVNRLAKPSCENLTFHNAEHDLTTEYVLAGPLNWTMAKSSCEQMGGHLAVVDNEEENTFLEAILSEVGIGTKIVWVGATDDDREGSWIWIDGRPLVYSDWLSGQPNGEETQNCAGIKAQAGWQSNPCSNNFRYICEKKI